MDPWAIFTFAVAGLAIPLIAVVIAWKQTQRKGFSYAIELYERLMAPSEILKGQVQILFAGEPVNDVSMLIIHFWNAGNVPIKREDFEKPISIRFADVDILAADLLRATPSDLDVTLKQLSKRHLEIRPLLLNHKDGFFLKLMVTGSMTDPKVEARIIGIHQIEQEEYRVDPTYLRVLQSVATVFALLVAINTLIFMTLLPSHPDSTLKLFLNATFLICILGFLAAVTTRWGIRRWRRRNRLIG